MSASIRLKTAVPGPLSRALAARRDAAVPRGIGHSTPVYARSARGATVTDVDGNVFIDFAGGIGTLNVGHANPDVVRAAAEQLERMTHTCFSVAPYEGYVALAEKLNRITPGSLSEEDDARQQRRRGPRERREDRAPRDRPRGRRRLRARLSRPHAPDDEHDVQGPALQVRLRALRPGGLSAPLPLRVPRPLRRRRPTPRRELEDFFKTQVAAEKVACVVVELVAGEGGFIVAPPEWVEPSRAVLPRPRHPPRRRRGPDRLRPNRSHVRLRALRSRARRDDDGQVARRRASPSRPSPAAPRSWTPRTSAASAEPTPATRSPAPRRSRRSSSSSASVCPNARPAIGEEVERRFQCFVERFPFVGDARGLGAMRALELVRGSRHEGTRQGPHRPGHPKGLRERGSCSSAPAPTATSSARSCRSSSPTTSSRKVWMFSRRRSKARRHLFCVGDS